MSFWITTKRVARYGLVGFVRNGFISLSAILILTITLLVLASLIIGRAALGSVLSDLTNKVDITIYLTPSSTQDQVDALTKDLKALPQVQSVSYVSQDAALEQFQARHQNDQLVMQALQELGDNPLGASLQVRAKDTAQYQTIAQFLQTQQKNGTSEGQAIDTVNYFQNQTAIERLTSVIQTSRSIGIGIAIILAIASVLIAFNTIRLAIYTSRDEIAVMNLVGASPWYVRGPFMIAGVLYGVVSGLVVMLLLYPITLALGPGSQQFLGSFNVYTYYVDWFPVLFFVIIGSGIALGVLSSYLAIRRYLR